jgi:integrase
VETRSGGKRWTIPCARLSFARALAAILCGRVYLRGAVWWVQYSFRGRVYRESSQSSHRADAVKLLRRRLAEMGRGRLVGPDLERTTFDDLAKILLDDYRVNGRKSLRNAVGSLGTLRAVFGTALARDITLPRLQAYVVARLQAGRQPATVYGDLAILKRAFHLAERAGLAIRPPFPTLTIRNTRVGFFEPAEFHAVLAGLPADLQPVAEFAYLTGWRRAEILTLEWRHVDLQAGIVRLDPGSTKNDDGRTFPFAVLPPLAALLRRQRDHTSAVERATDQLIRPVFHRQGAPIRDFRTAWKHAVLAAGFSRVDPTTHAPEPTKLFHDFRRTAVRNLERAGVPRSVAMKLTGHKTESVYRRYAIVAEADLSEGVARLAALHARHEPAPQAAVVPLLRRTSTELAHSAPPQITR